ncbi:MAG: hypothetical protein V3T10_03335 [Candidatus Bathyarchaeia archaeon]
MTTTLPSQSNFILKLSGQAAFLYMKPERHYAHTVATMLEGVQSLIEQGFEYITEITIGETTYILFRRKKLWQLS